MIKRFEAKTLEEAFELASKELDCSVDKLEYNITQYPSKGILGFFSKNAIIEVDHKVKNRDNQKEQIEKSVEITDKTDAKEEIKDIAEEKVETKEENSEKSIDDTSIIDNFYAKKNLKEEKKIESISAIELEEKIKSLFKNSCYDLDTIEVDIEENTAYVFIDGVDAALLIGKEGYRYNALSYLLFNWVNSRYGLYLKLEIAQFLASQQDMIVNQLKPVVDHINKEGWGRTRELNGILVQIALEYLRDTFPNKYVAIKRSRSGERYIVINEFNKR